MRELNPAVGPSKLPLFSLAYPDVRVFEVHGKRIAFDCNSLAAGLLAGREQLDNWGQRAKPQFRGLPDCRVRKLVLNVTHACNLACRYCFVRKGTGAEGDRSPRAVVPRSGTLARRRHEKAPVPLLPPGPTMPPQMAVEAVNRLFDAQTDINLAFFGGEPLLAWDTVVAAMSHAESLARARKVKASFHITTNATLLDEAKAAELKRRNCSLLVSMDGPPGIHNAWRPAKNPKMDSHAATLAALKLLHSAGLSGRVSIRATYPMEDPSLMERLRYFAGLQDGGLVGGFSVEPAIMTEGCARAGKQDFDLDELQDEYHRAAVWYLGRLRKGKPTGFFHFRKLLQRLTKRELSASECGAGCGYLTVGPDGSIFACHREAGTLVGRLDVGVDEELRFPWRDNRLYGKPLCVRCWARYVCGGGCRQIAAERGEPLTSSYPQRCALMQTIIRECLWILAEFRGQYPRRDRE
jgi:uncharacterized protein